MFRKSDQTWHILPQPREGRITCLRGFGRYLTGLESRDDRTPKDRIGHGLQKSPGRERWADHDSRWGPALEGRLSGTHSYPGVLYVYDVDTEYLYTIRTNQGDSEVLLIDGRNVYYRAADQLFSAVIGERSIGPARLITTDDAIRDAHWAFVKR